MAGNANLHAANKAKNDEFYTQFPDIEKEINAYLDFNEDTFRDKTVLLPCDDPEWSNFTRYFAQNFEKLGLKKMISTSYAIESKKYKSEWTPTLFEQESPQYDPDKSQTHGKIFVLDRDTDKNGRIDYFDIGWKYLSGDGDFRSDEVKALRDESDVIVTNPPFSLFREFLAWIVEADKKFLIIGNMNAVTYKEVFPLIKENKMWIGATRGGVGFMWFMVSDDFPERNGQKIVDGQKYQTIGSSAWFTNLDHGRRHERLPLLSMADNIKFSRHKELRGKSYSKYDNYDAIEVPFTDAIPGDYDGVMGVPISFLDKWCPEQFEIVGITESNGRGWSNGLFDETSTTLQPMVNGKKIYVRIFIRKINK